MTPSRASTFRPIAAARSRLSRIARSDQPNGDITMRRAMSSPTISSTSDATISNTRFRTEEMRRPDVNPSEKISHDGLVLRKSTRPVSRSRKVDTSLT